MGMWIDPEVLARMEREGRVTGLTPKALPVALPEGISEKEFQALVIQMAKDFGWKMIYHTHNSRKSAAGFPDLILIRGDLLLAAELKVGANTPTPAQEDWLHAFERVSCVDAQLWYPKDLNTIREVLK
jgi:hypothetical protein